MGLCNLFRRNKKPHTADAEKLAERQAALQRFWFLADAPMFIDGVLVDRLYDSIFRPELELVSTVEGTSNELAGKVATSAKAGAEVSVKLPPALALFGLDVAGKGSTEISGSAEGSGKRGNSLSRTFSAINTPERHLEKLISLYAGQYPQRLLWVNSDLETINTLQETPVRLTWDRIEDTLLSTEVGPRPLVVFDLEPETRLMPMYGELEGGKGHELLENYVTAYARESNNGFVKPNYPSEPDATDAERVAYWLQVAPSFNSKKIIRAIETAADTARFDWIAYRLLPHDGAKVETAKVPHLHLMARGNFPTGTFAYNLVRRANRFGIRIVGTLKKGQDINVLAVYER